MTNNLNIRKIFFLALLIFCANLFAASNGYTPKKREFRGAWIQCVNGQFIGMSTEKMQQTLIYQLDELQKDGVNAIFFQVRAECDALYQSDIEPWSRLQAYRVRHRNRTGTHCSG